MTSSCGLFGSKKKEAAKPKTPSAPLFNARDIEFYDLSPETIRVTALPNQFDSLVIGDLARLQSNFTGNPTTLPKVVPVKPYGEIGEPMGALGAQAYDLFRPHLGIHAKYSTHFCQDMGFFRKLSIQERDLRLPQGETFMMDWPTRGHDDGHTFIAAEKLKTGERQWRIVHYAKKIFQDAYIFRFNPVTETFRQIVVLRDQSFWLADIPMFFKDEKWNRDEKKPVRVKANLKWMKSEFDVALQGARVLGDWRWLNKEETKLNWMRANLVGRWGTFTFRPQKPAFVPREIAIIDSDGQRQAGVYDFDSATYIRYESNAALRALNPPRPAPERLTYNDWGTALDLISAITVDENISKTVEPKVIVAMTEAPERPCVLQGRMELPLEFYSMTPAFRKAFNLPEPTPVPVPVVEPTPVDTSDAPVIRDPLEE